MRNDPLIVSIIFSVVFLTIGMSTYMMGCNTTLYPAGCVAYSPEVAIVNSTGTSSEECCIFYTKINDVQICSLYKKCWHGVVYFDTCTYDDGMITFDESYARTSINERYKLGNVMTVFRERRDMGKCTPDMMQVQTTLPIVGIVFLCLSGLMIIIAYFNTNTNIKTETHPQPNMYV
jgi:hypothetical protein